MSESSKTKQFTNKYNLTINTGKIMEITGSETMSGRVLYNNSKFIPKMNKTKSPEIKKITPKMMYTKTPESIKIANLNHDWKNSRKTEQDAAKFIAEYPKKKLEIINPNLTVGNIKFEILKHKTTTDKKNINTMKKYFNIWKNNTELEDKTNIIPEFNNIYINSLASPASPNVYTQTHYDVKSSSFHDYRYNFDHYDDTYQSNTLNYDSSYDTYDTNDKLYGDYDDWEDYHDSIYN